MPRDPTAPFLQQVWETIDRYRMLAPGDRVLVAVSGGPDSIALLAALVDLSPRCRVQVYAAHFNHRLRGSESDRDQHCAESVARRLAIPMVAEAAPCDAGGASSEARARVQRYAFLERVAHAQGCGRIATGHTLNDQAETVLMRLVRGAGAAGLAGIPPVRDDLLIRPLIACSRSDVMAFLQARGLEFCEDSSNHDRRFLRNRIRHDVLPMLRLINPNVQRQLASAGAILAEESELLDQLAHAALEAARSGAAVRVTGLLSHPRALQARLLRAWLTEQRGHLLELTETQVRALMTLARAPRPNATIPLPGGGWVTREYDLLRFSTDVVHSPEPTCRQRLAPGSSVMLESGWQIDADLVPAHGSMPLPTDLRTLFADAARLATPLTVRTARPGDRIRPLGMEGQRKLQDVFTDRKVGRVARQSCPVVEANGEILWLPGLVRSAHALVTPETRLLLRLQARKTGIAGP